jgi:hypothetical protein
LVLVALVPMELPQHRQVHLVVMELILHLHFQQEL